MKNKKMPHIGKVLISCRKSIEIGKIDTSNTQILDRSLSWLGTGTSIKSGEVELVLCAKPHLLVK
jgi:hypothetical protein